METSWKPYHKTALNQPFIYLKYSRILQDNLQLGGGLYLESQPRVSRPSLGNANSCITITKRLASNVLFCSGYHGYRDKVEDGICLRPEGKKITTQQSPLSVQYRLLRLPFLPSHSTPLWDIMDTATRTSCLIPPSFLHHLLPALYWRIPSYMLLPREDGATWYFMPWIAEMSLHALKVFFEQCWNYSLCKVIS